jgi:hypothetical protein
VESRGHVVTYISSDDSANDWPCDAVAICTGLHVVPNIPNIQGIQSIRKVLHSSELRRRTNLALGRMWWYLVAERLEWTLHIWLWPPRQNLLRCVTVMGFFVHLRWAFQPYTIFSDWVTESSRYRDPRRSPRCSGTVEYSSRCQQCKLNLTQLMSIQCWIILHCCGLPTMIDSSNTHYGWCQVPSMA